MTTIGTIGSASRFTPKMRRNPAHPKMINKNANSKHEDDNSPMFNAYIKQATPNPELIRETSDLDIEPEEVYPSYEELHWASMIKSHDPISLRDYDVEQHPSGMISKKSANKISGNLVKSLKPKETRMTFDDFDSDDATPTARPGRRVMRTARKSDEGVRRNSGEMRVKRRPQEAAPAPAKRRPQEAAPVSKRGRPAKATAAPAPVAKRGRPAKANAPAPAPAKRGRPAKAAAPAPAKRGRPAKANAPAPAPAKRGRPAKAAAAPAPAKRGRPPAKAAAPAPAAKRGRPARA